MGSLCNERKHRKERGISSFLSQRSKRIIDQLFPWYIPTYVISVKSVDGWQWCYDKDKKGNISLINNNII